MQSHDSDDRTEQPTARRLERAREQGQLARSRELSTALLLAAACAGLWSFENTMLTGMETMMTEALSPAALSRLDQKLIFSHSMAMLWQSLQVVLPLLGVLFLSALFTPVLSGGWSFRLEAVMPDIDRLDPLKGIGRLVSWQGLMEIGKSLLKLLLVAVMTWFVTGDSLQDLHGLDQLEPAAGIMAAISLMTAGLLWISAATLLPAALDVPYQIWSHLQKLRMTRQELRDEMKESEGRPEVKSRLRSLRQEYARARMMTKVPKADVVIMNPEHFAVALRYHRDKDAAPVVIAKGVDLMAIRIRECAKGAGVPVVTIPSLARAIYHSTKIDQPVPSGLFHAVARVLAYVYQLRHAPRGRTLHVPTEADISIPGELRV